MLVIVNLLFDRKERNLRADDYKEHNKMKYSVPFSFKLKKWLIITVLVIWKFYLFKICPSCSLLYPDAIPFLPSTASQTSVWPRFCSKPFHDRDEKKSSAKKIRNSWTYMFVF